MPAVTDPALVVRPAHPADASRIAGLHVRSWRDAYRSFMPAAYLDTLDQDAHRIGYWQPMLDREEPGLQVWIAFWAGVPAGFVNIEPPRPEPLPSQIVPEGLGWIDHLHVAPELRGRGVGFVLFRQALEALREAGFAEAALWVYEENTPARAFYDRVGWVPDGTSAPKRIAWVGRDGVPGEITPTMVRYRGATRL